MNEPKTFINGVFIKEVTFRDGGSLLSVSIPEDKVDSLADQLKAAARDGWVKLRIAKNRQPTVNRSGKTIATHSLSVDTWQPKQEQPRQQSASQDNESGEVPF